MLKVLLVDDEPFILKGLQVLIDWKKEGFEIVATASNGQEAIELLKKQEVDLIISDINMPLLTGLDLLKKIREEKLSDAYFVILSGYADFSYAQQAIRYDCTDYIVKPVEREELQKVLGKVVDLRASKEEEEEATEKRERAYLARNIIALIKGKYDQMNLNFVKQQMRLSEEIRYIEIELDEASFGEESSDEEKRAWQRRLFEACVDFLKKDSDHCVFDVSGEEKIYDIGLVYCNYMADQQGIAEEEYLGRFSSYLRDVARMPAVILVGKKVSDISQIAKSFGTACMLRSFEGFRDQKNIYYYEDEVQVSSSGIVLCKKSIDGLLAAIEQNNPAQMSQAVEFFFEEMQNMGASAEIRTLNINYLLFQLIHLATEQDDCVNQEEILRIISGHTVEEGINRGSKLHVSRFVCEYAEYLAQLRKNVSRGVLGDVEREIRERYAENLTLKELSEKYFVNSAYLGQLFRKKYGCSFKDYLNQYRIEQAATLLARTDRKIYEIAEETGYHDLDYFVNRFIAVKGCTPAKYRRQLDN